MALRSRDGVERVERRVGAGAVAGVAVVSEEVDASACRVRRAGAGTDAGPAVALVFEGGLATVAVLDGTRFAGAGSSSSVGSGVAFVVREGGRDEPEPELST
jgi:hypothetical protein